MGKYIDADKAIKDYAHYGIKHFYDATDLEAILNECPAADVAEVRHGEWVFKFYCGNMSGYDYGMTCSVCGKPMYRQFAEKMPPYCPNCGAKMDGDTE